MGLWWSGEAGGQAIPRKTASARVTVSMVSSSSRPIEAPMRSRRTDIALSIITWDGFVRPFAALGSIGGLSSGASVRVPVRSRTVTVPVASKASA